MGLETDYIVLSRAVNAGRFDDSEFRAFGASNSHPQPALKVEILTGHEAADFGWSIEPEQLCDAHLSSHDLEIV